MLKFTSDNIECSSCGSHAVECVEHEKEYLCCDCGTKASKEQIQKQIIPSLEIFFSNLKERLETGDVDSLFKWSK